MFPNSTSDWIAFIGILIPLTIASITAVIYVFNQLQDNQYRNYKKFFEITDSIGRKDGSIVSKVAAIHELSNYKSYKDVIIRICDGVDVGGDTKPAELLRQEMLMTRDYFKNI